MRASGSPINIPVMTRPATSAKVLLVADRRFAAADAETDSAPVRRYRLARLRFEGRTIDLASRFEHLKRVYD
jgi:hypothetical protein